MKFRRVFLIVLDSVGIGEEPDAAQYGDAGSNTLRSCFDSGRLHLPTLSSLGLFHIDGIDFGKSDAVPLGTYARLQEASAGKDTTIGHWELTGLISPQPLPTYPNGFPPEIIDEFERRTGKKTLCNRPYSGTDVIRDFGQEHLRTDALIVYTSADSVFQIAAHEDLVPPEELYHYCRIAREILQGKHGVGRVIARPFTGKCAADFKRTSNRHDFSLESPAPTLLDMLKAAGREVIGIGKIGDIFAGHGLTSIRRTKNNSEGMQLTLNCTDEPFCGLCFVNLVDFDMIYGHRNDVLGYTEALNLFDCQLAKLLPKLHNEDLLMITADHGCDPGTPSTDHSREYVPLLLYGKRICQNVSLNTRSTFADVAATVADALNAPYQGAGESLLPQIERRDDNGL